MPPFFFHVKLELYPAPAPTASLQKRRSNNHVSRDFYIPCHKEDIFEAALPAHRSTPWTSHNFDLRAIQPSTPSSAPSSSKKSDSHGEALLLPERNTQLREPPRSPLVSPTHVKPSNEGASRDWRYDPISIESINMESQGSAARGKTGAHAKSSVNGLQTKAVYIPSDPKITEVGWGVVHLYRDIEESSYLESDLASTAKTLDRARSAKDESGDLDDCTTLCILAVPSWMMPSDLLGFVGDQAREDVSHFRLIRTGRANKYMVLLKFRQARRAREWQKAYNGRLFSAAEPENCHVVFIKSVEFLSPDADMDGDASNFPHNTNDPFTSTSAMGESAREPKGFSSKPFAPPPPNLLELPTCPVCLERMDETTGLLTILCQHVFHCACLEKWRGSGCPVCRYTHSPSYTFPYPRPTHNGISEEQHEAPCSVCASTDNLWICLICGNIGCGRYDSAHAYAHYEATSHCYAMDISTQHVWDYAGDGYVHRLIQSKPDSRLIDLPSSQQTRHENEAFRAEGGDSVPREKMESMANEYTYLLTSQLEGQRRYFEEQVERAVDKASQASARAEDAASRAEKASAALARTEAAGRSLSDDLSRVEKALEKSEKAKGKFEQMARDMSARLREEKMMNEGLSQRITAAERQAREAIEEAEKVQREKRELEEMNHDLSMFISSQEKVRELQAQGEEVVDGTIGVPEPAKRKGKGRKK